MSSTPVISSSLLDLIAHGGPIRAVADNQNIEADTGQRNASAALSQAQVPLVNAQTQQEQAKAQQAQIATQQAQQQLKEEQLYQQWIMAMTRTPTFVAGGTTGSVPNAGPPAPAPPQATPTQIAQSRMPGGMINRTGDAVDGVPSLPQAPAPPAAGTGSLMPGAVGLRTGDVQPAAAPAQPTGGVPNPGTQAPLTLSTIYDDPFRTALEYAKWAGPRGGGSGPFVQSLIQNGMAIKQKLLALEPEKLKASQASLEPVVDLLTGVTGLPDGPSKDQAWAQARPEIVKLHPELDKRLPAAAPGITNDQLQVPLALAHGLKAALDQQETQQKIKTAQATAEKDTAQAGEFSQSVADKKRAEAAATLAAAASPNEYEAARLRMPATTAVLFPSATQVFDANGKQLPDAADNIRFIGMSPDEQTKAAQARAQLAHEQTVSAESARHNRASEANASAELSVRKAEADPFGALGINPKAVANTGQGLTGEEYLKTLPPQLQPIVHQIATGQQAPISGFALTKPYGQQIMAAVAQYDPSFSADRANERKAFSSGKQGQNIQALNTAAVHLDQLKDAAAALNNHTLVPGNQLYNTIAQTFGVAAPTNFEALKNVAAGELANAYKGAATDEEIRNISKTITAAQSPQQLAGTLSTQLHALAAKLNTYDEQYHQKIPNDTFSPVLPSARAVFEKNGIKPLRSDASDWKTQAKNAKPGDVIDLPNGHQAKKNADGTFTQLTK